MSDIRTSPKHPDYSVEVSDTASGFAFRLHHIDGRQTNWVNYEGICLIDDVVAVSAYYTGNDDALELRPISAVQFVQCAATGCEVSNAD